MPSGRDIRVELFANQDPPSSYAQPHFVINHIVASCLVDAFSGQFPVPGPDFKSGTEAGAPGYDLDELATDEAAC